MDQNRKDVLKRGIDVTLYPLPFRKGGKIKVQKTIGNSTMGDKTIKPGIEYANGGVMLGNPPPINSLRLMNPPKVAADTIGDNSLTSAFTDKPKFRNKKEHDAHHKQRVLTRMASSHPELLSYYHDMSAKGRHEDAEAAIMAAGGIPQYTQSVEPPQQAPIISRPTDFKNIGFKVQKTGGYRYGVNKPAKGSITNIGLGARRSKFGK